MAHFKTSRARTYTEEGLTMAVVSVRDLGTSFYKAAKLYNVPETTIKNYLRNPDFHKMGSPCKFTQEEERLIVETLLEFAEVGMPLNKDYLKDLVHHLSEEKGEYFLQAVVLYTHNLISVKRRS